MKWLITAVLIGTLGYVLLDTRFGVFITFDILGDIGSDNLDVNPDRSPLTLTRKLTHTEKVELPAAIEQASGIDVTSAGIFISTDQAELFQLTHEMQGVKTTELMAGPLLLKQGSLEAIQLQGEYVVGVGEFGEIRRWQISDHAAATPLALDPNLQSLEFTGLTALDGELYATTDESTAIWNLTHIHRLELDFGEHVRPERRSEELLFSGISHHQGSLLVLTENHTQILRVNPVDGSVIEVIGIDAGEASDLDVHDGKAYVTVDHNYFDARPPLFVYKL